MIIFLEAVTNLPSFLTAIITIASLIQGYFLFLISAFNLQPSISALIAILALFHNHYLVSSSINVLPSLFAVLVCLSSLIHSFMMCFTALVLFPVGYSTAILVCSFYQNYMLCLYVNNNNNKEKGRNSLESSPRGMSSNSSSFSSSLWNTFTREVLVSNINQHVPIARAIPFEQILASPSS